MKEEEAKNLQASKRNVFKYLLAGVGIFIFIGFVAIVIVVVLYYVPSTNREEIDTTTGIPKPTDLDTTIVMTTTTLSDIDVITSMSIFNYFPEANNDGLNIRFYHSVNTEEELNLALKENASDALEGDVNLRYYGSPSQTDEVVMNSFPEQIADLTLEEWLDQVIPSGRLIKLDLTVNEVVPMALEILRQRSPTLNQPVWISAEVLEGPLSKKPVLNFEAFMSYLNDLFPHVTVSLGWTNSVRFVKVPEYTWEMMDKMMELVQTVSQQVTILARASLVRKSWEKFLWFMEECDSCWLTVYDQPYDFDHSEDLAFVRDNTDYSRVIYDITEDAWKEFQNYLNLPNRVKSFYTGGNVLEYFRIPARNALQVTWAHRVVKKADLNETLNSDKILMLETDIQLYGTGTELENSSLPVMAHDPPALNYELTFEEWMQEVINSNQTKGIKLDFKSIDALQASLPILANLQPSLRMPIWINSDVMMGPNSVTQPRNATLFFSMIQEYFPDVTLSPGWTTTYRPTGNNEGYSQEMVEDMYAACSNMRQAITFPVRASLSQRSIPQFQWLLAQSNRYTLTIWHSTSETVSISDLLEVYYSFPSDNVYYDLPDEIMKEFLQAIQDQ